MLGTHTDPHHYWPASLTIINTDPPVFRHAIWVSSTFHCYFMNLLTLKISTVKFVWNDPLWKDQFLWKDHFPIPENVYLPLNSMQSWTFLERPPLWKKLNHILLKFWVVVPDRFNCSLWLFTIIIQFWILMVIFDKNSHWSHIVCEMFVSANLGFTCFSGE